MSYHTSLSCMQEYKNNFFLEYLQPLIRAVVLSFSCLSFITVLSRHLLIFHCASHCMLYNIATFMLNVLCVCKCVCVCGWRCESMHTVIACVAVVIFLAELLVILCLLFFFFFLFFFVRGMGRLYLVALRGPLVFPWLCSIDSCIAVYCHGWHWGVARCWCGENSLPWFHSFFGFAIAFHAHFM